MKRRWIFALLAIGIGSLWAQESQQQAVYGQWRIVREVAASNEAKLSGDDIESLIGARAQYAAHIVNFAGEECLRPVYDSYEETRDSLLNQHNLLAEDLQLKTDTAWAVEIGCANGDESFGAGTWLLIIGSNRLITEVDGVYFELQRAPQE